MKQIKVTYPDNTTVNLNNYQSGRTITSAVQKEELMGENTVRIQISSAKPFSIPLGSHIEIFNETYYLNRPEEPVKNSTNHYQYNLTFESIKYDLLKISYLNGINNTSTDQLAHGNFTLTGKLETFLTLLKINTERTPTAFKFEISDPAKKTTQSLKETTKDISFTNENCLSALNKIVETFECEYEISNNRTILISTQIGIKNKTSLKYGPSGGIKNIRRTNTQTEGLITKLWVHGGNTNLPIGYRNYSPYLRLPEDYKNDFIQHEEKIAQSGIIEGTFIADDIIPSRTGTITALNKDNPAILIDSGIDFDIYEIDDNGNTRYIANGEKPMINFKTGKLAGMNFEIKQNSSNLPKPLVEDIYPISNVDFNLQTQTVKKEIITEELKINKLTDIRYRINVKFNDTSSPKIGASSTNKLPDFGTLTPLLTIQKFEAGKFTSMPQIKLPPLTVENNFNITYSNTLSNKYEETSRFKIIVTLEYKVTNTTGYQNYINQYNLSGEMGLSVSKYISEGRTIELIPITSEDKQIYPSAKNTMAISDQYVIYNIIPPTSYIIEAEQKLLARAEEYYEKISTPKASYSIELDNIFYKTYSAEYSFNPGDYVLINDTDININDYIRIKSTEHDLLDESSLRIELTEYILRAKTYSKITTLSKNITKIESAINSNNQTITSIKENVTQKIDYKDIDEDPLISSKITNTVNTVNFEDDGKLQLELNKKADKSALKALSGKDTISTIDINDYAITADKISNSPVELTKIKTNLGINNLGTLAYQSSIQNEDFGPGSIDAAKIRSDCFVDDVATYSPDTKFALAAIKEIHINSNYSPDYILKFVSPEYIEIINTANGRAYQLKPVEKFKTFSKYSSTEGHTAIVDPRKLYAPHKIEENLQLSYKAFNNDQKTQNTIYTNFYNKNIQQNEIAIIFPTISETDGFTSEITIIEETENIYSKIFGSIKLKGDESPFIVTNHKLFREIILGINKGGMLTLGLKMAPQYVKFQINIDKLIINSLNTKILPITTFNILPLNTSELNTYRTVEFRGLY